MANQTYTVLESLQVYKHSPPASLTTEARTYSPTVGTTHVGATGVHYELFVRAFADSDNDGITDFYGIDSDYNTLAVFRRLIAEAHKRGDMGGCSLFYTSRHQPSDPMGL